MEKRDMAPLILPSESIGVPSDRGWPKDPGRSREEETFTLGIKLQSPSHLPSPTRGLNTSTMHLARGHTFSWQWRISTVLQILPPLYWIFCISTLTSEMTFHWARISCTLGCWQLPELIWQDFFHTLMWKTEPLLTPRHKSVICGLEGEKEKKTYIGITIKKQVRVTRDLSTIFQGAGEGIRIHSYLVSAAELSLLGQAASSKPPKSSAWMEKNAA